MPEGDARLHATRKMEKRTEQVDVDVVEEAYRRMVLR